MSETTEPSNGQHDQQGYDTEKLKNNSAESIPRKNGGARPGAGRKKGGMNLATKERLAIRNAFVDRIHNNAQRLLDAALSKALGEMYLYKQVTIGTGTKSRRETSIVTDPEIIREYLDDTLDYDRDTEYYYITTKPVDMIAVKELYDRAFGKALQTAEISGRDGEPLAMTPEQAAQLIALRAERGND